MHSDVQKSQKSPMKSHELSARGVWVVESCCRAPYSGREGWCAGWEQPFLIGQILTVVPVCLCVLSLCVRVYVYVYVYVYQYNTPWNPSLPSAKQSSSSPRGTGGLCTL